MPTYAQHVLQSIQNATEPVTHDHLLALVRSDRQKSGLHTCSERHVNNAIDKLINGKIIRKEPDGTYCMMDRSPMISEVSERSPNATGKATQVVGEPDKTKTSKSANKNTIPKTTKKKRISAYNLFTKNFMAKHKNGSKRNVLMQQVSKAWKKVKKNKPEHQYWIAQAKIEQEKPVQPSSATSNTLNEKSAETPTKSAKDGETVVTNHSMESLNFDLDVAEISAEFDAIRNKLPQIITHNASETSSSKAQPSTDKTKTEVQPVDQCEPAPVNRKLSSSNMQLPPVSMSKGRTGTPTPAAAKTTEPNSVESSAKSAVKMTTESATESPPLNKNEPTKPEIRDELEDTQKPRADQTANTPILTEPSNQIKSVPSGLKNLEERPVEQPNKPKAESPKTQQPPQVCQEPVVDNPQEVQADQTKPSSTQQVERVGVSIHAESEQDRLKKLDKSDVQEPNNQQPINEPLKLSQPEQKCKEPEHTSDVGTLKEGQTEQRDLGVVSVGEVNIFGAIIPPKDVIAHDILFSEYWEEMMKL